ncbi:dynein regulatory complex protein 1 [Hypomesus transpacificus]|uniref:dynein regulatory complex protein 1 n=1 Tax=Hypomesus transpacificus TaxID=137520 RepID=UPI001F071FE5|nr:dynein regulatory complex protein 1 [Hypomesus transpacificus]
MSQSGTLHEDLGEAGPSLDSENPEERIAARRLRIAARKEARRRQELGDDSNEKKEIEEETRKSQIQVDQSEKRMLNLLSDGTELVTNVMVAADARESQCRAEIEEARRLRVEKLENEAKVSLEKFEDINKKWMVAKMKDIPQDLRDSLISQQQLCGLLVQDKNNLITELQQELKQADDCYVKDLKRQAEDVDLMIERMEDQVKILNKSYRVELDQIESAYESERKVLLTGDREKWEQHMKERSDNELENLMQRMRRVEEYEVLLDQVRVEDAEEYNMIKIKLDTDVQILEQQLQQMKATYQLNQEKLEYNFQVLKKRDEENAITKSQQKRKITRQQDVLNNLKVKCSNQEKQSKEENQSLTEDYQRIMQQYKHMQKKMRHFAAIDSKRFEDMWVMNEAEVKELVEKALDIDCIIYQQQLGLAWERPSLPFMERCGPIRPQKQAQRTARQTASELLHSGKTNSSSLGTREASVGPRAMVEASVGPGAMVEASVGPGAMVEASVGPGAMVEASVGPGAMVEASVGPGAMVEASVGPGAMVEASVGPGAMVEAGAGPGARSSGLAVEREREDSKGEMEKKESEVQGEVSVLTVKRLLELLCDETGFLIESKLLKLLSPLDRDEQSLMKLDAIFTAMGIESEEDVNKMADFFIKYPQQQEERAVEVPADDNEGRGRSCPSTPTSNLIHPNDVLKALRAFTAQHQPKRGGMGHQQLRGGLGQRDDSEDAAYWDSMANVIPENKLRIWAELETSMEKYHTVLTERSKLMTETQSVKQQNTELRMLLHQYVTSKVNTELEIPPTQAMQLVQE